MVAVLQNPPEEERSGGIQPNQCSDFLCKRLSVANRQPIRTTCRCIEKWEHQELFIPPCSGVLEQSELPMMQEGNSALQFIVENCFLALQNGCWRDYSDWTGKCLWISWCWNKESCYDSQYFASRNSSEIVGQLSSSPDRFADDENNCLNQNIFIQ